MMGRLFVVCCVFIGATLASAIPVLLQADFEVDIISLFQDWMVEHGKYYSSTDEYQKRLQIFKENVVFIQESNTLAKGNGKSMRMGLNQFADMSQTEFRTKVLLPSRTPELFPESRYAPLSSLTDGGFDGLPDEFDWNSQGAVTPVRDQGTVGTCWAFSAVENIESQFFIRSHELVELSVEQVVDCDNSTDPSNLNSDCGVFGGWPYLAYGFVGRIGGLESESNYSYCCGTGACYPCEPPGFNKTRCGPPPTYCNKTESCSAKLDRASFVPGVKVSSWVAIQPLNETEMQAQLYQRGPLSVLMDASTLQFYHSGVFDPRLCSKTETDHAILLTGYGNTYNGEQEPYWIIRNSWGVKWGMEGYFYLKRGENTCAIATMPTCSVLD